MLITIEASLRLLTLFFCPIIGLYILERHLQNRRQQTDRLVRHLELAFRSAGECSTTLAVERLKKDNQLAALSQELSTTKEQLKALEAANATLASSKESTDMELSQQLTSKASQLHTLATQTKDKDDTIVNLNQYLNTLKSNLATAHSKIEALQTTIDTQSYDLEDFSKLRVAMEEEKDACQSNLVGTIRAFTGQINELQAENAELQQEKEMLATSLANLTQVFELLTGLYLQTIEAGEYDTRG
jgi:chromosome segregation ATPase